MERTRADVQFGNESIAKPIGETRRGIVKYASRIDLGLRPTVIVIPATGTIRRRPRCFSRQPPKFHGQDVHDFVEIGLDPQSTLFLESDGQTNAHVAPVLRSVHRQCLYVDSGAMKEHGNARQQVRRVFRLDQKRHAPRPSRGQFRHAHAVLALNNIQR